MHVAVRPLLREVWIMRLHLPLAAGLVALTACASHYSRVTDASLGLAPSASSKPSQLPLRVTAAQPAPVGQTAHVPAATYRMGSDVGEPDERPAHVVHVGAFDMDLTE